MVEQGLNNIIHKTIEKDNKICQEEKMLLHKLVDR